MKSNWEEECEKLRKFVSDNPAIILTKNEISIPQELRDQFYLQFDNVRSALVDQHYSKLPVDVEGLCRQYLKIETEVIELLGIERVSMPVDLHSFLHAPKEGMARSIYSRLFDLLQGKTTMESFEQQCIDDLNGSASELYRIGYEWWAGLTLVKLLEPEKAFFVDLDDDNKPFLTELKEISFGRQAHHPTMRIPEFVLLSKRLGRYIAVKMAIAREIETYARPGLRPPVRPKRPTGDTSLALDSRVMLLSFMSGPHEVPIIADTYDCTLTSPDWMLECVTQDEFRNPEAVEEVKYRLSALNPKLGSCMVVIGDSDQELEPVSEAIRTISVGFDETKFQPIIADLACKV